MVLFKLHFYNNSVNSKNNGEIRCESIIALFEVMSAICGKKREKIWYNVYWIANQQLKLMERGKEKCNWKQAAVPVQLVLAARSQPNGVAYTTG